MTLKKFSPHASLRGKFLIAHPNMRDPRFEKAVIFLCVHDEEHAMGVRLNRPRGELYLSDFLEQMDIEGQFRPLDRLVLYGGPVEEERGFLLHDVSYFHDGASIQVTDDIVLSNTKEALEALVSADAPQKALLALGYAGWGPGQLEGEISENAWLISDAPTNLVFTSKPETLWDDALSTVGITAANLSIATGHA